MLIDNISNFINNYMVIDDTTELGKSIVNSMTEATRWFLHNYFNKQLQRTNYTLFYNSLIGGCLRLLTAIFVKNMYVLYPMSREVYYIVLGLVLMIITIEIQQKIINKPKKN